jgi:hypothetical protein
MLIINKNIVHNNKRCNTLSKNFLIFFFARVLHQPITSALPSLLIRFKTVPSPFHRMGEKWELHRVWLGFARESQTHLAVLEAFKKIIHDDQKIYSRKL